MGFGLSAFDDEYKNQTAATDGNGYPTAPDGLYHMKVVDASLAKTKDFKPQLKWKLRIIGPKCEGVTIWHNNNFHHDNKETRGKLLSMVKTDLKVCGLPELDSLGELEDAAVRAKLVGVLLEVELKTGAPTAQGRTFQNSYFKKRVEFVTESTSVIAAVGAGVSGNGGNGAAVAVGPDLSSDCPF